MKNYHFEKIKSLARATFEASSALYAYFARMDAEELRAISELKKTGKIICLSSQL